MTRDYEPDSSYIVEIHAVPAVIKGIADFLSKKRESYATLSEKNRPWLGDFLIVEQTLEYIKLYFYVEDELDDVVAVFKELFENLDGSTTDGYNPELVMYKYKISYISFSSVSEAFEYDLVIEKEERTTSSDEISSRKSLRIYQEALTYSDQTGNVHDKGGRYFKEFERPTDKRDYEVIREYLNEENKYVLLLEELQNVSDKF